MSWTLNTNQFNACGCVIFQDVCLYVGSSTSTCILFKTDQNLINRCSLHKIIDDIDIVYYTTIKVFLLAMLAIDLIHYCHESNVTRLLKLTFKSNEQLIFDAKLYHVDLKTKNGVCHVNVQWVRMCVRVCTKSSYRMVSPESNSMALILQYLC